MSIIPESFKLAVYLITFLIGLCFGSFFLVMAQRFLKGESIVLPRSYCENTGRPIPWYDNLPILSYLLLGGCSRFDGRPIGLWYPITEMMTGVCFVMAVWYAGLTLQTLFLLFLLGNLIVITLTDLKDSLIFIINSLSLVPAGLLYSWLNLGGLPNTSTDVFGLFSLPTPLVESLLGIAAGFLLFEGLILASRVFMGTDGFGHGDTHLMMGLGAFFGWKLVVLGVFMGFIFQGVPAIPILVVQWIKHKRYKALGSGTAGVIFGLLPLYWVSLETLNPQLRLVLMLGSFALSLVSLFFFLRCVRQQESYTYLPLGPSLIAASVFLVFLAPSWLPEWAPWLP